MRYRVVIRNLQLPYSDPAVVLIGDALPQKDASAMQRRFAKLKWDERRPGVYTIDNIALCVEPMSNSELSAEEELKTIIGSLSRCLIVEGDLLAIATFPAGKILASGATMAACVADYRRKEAEDGQG